MKRIFSEETATLSGSASAAQGAAKNAKSNRISPFNRVITSARKLYARQLDQNASVKNRCMEHNVTKYYDEPQGGHPR